MGDGLLSLSWNNHKATFYHILSTLREKERYTDVTLACEGKFYPVHKLVLSTCSEYFESMFEHTPCKHPIIVLKDIKSDEVESLLSYMYAGVVNVAQNDLARLIKAAELLKVKGLAVPDEPPQEVESRKNVSPPWSSRDDRTSPHPKRRRREDSEGMQGESHMSSSPSASPRTSPFHAAPEYRQENSRTPSEAPIGEHRTEKCTDRLDVDVKTDQKAATDMKQDQPPSTKPGSPLQVMLDETLVKEEIIDPIHEEQDSLINSGMDYGSLVSDTRVENSTSDGSASDHHGQLLSAKFEQSLGPSQSQHLPEAVVEALAGPSGMQGWLSSGSDVGGGFSGVESYSGDGRHQDLRQALPSQQPQAHQMMVVRCGGRGGAGLSKYQATRRKHQCPYCPYTTHFITNFKRHVCTHTGEKPYACPHCTYRSNSNNHLKRHMNTHSGEKQFTCDKCSYRSSRKSVIESHKWSQHGYLGQIPSNLE